MLIYLPIAELPIDIFALLALGAVAGLMAGMFGIGGGFLMTPVLIYLGVGLPVAVASSSNQIIASSVSGLTAHLRRKSVDFKMGGYLLIGGFIGSIVGAKIFAWLQEVGQIDIAISLLYVFIVGSIGILMGWDSIKSYYRKKKDIEPKPRKDIKWVEGLPWKVYFEKSEMEVSLLLPVLLGFGSGILVSLLGIGGGFITIPVMIYVLRMPSSLVVGTSLFQMVLITAIVTFSHAYYSQTVDIILALILLLSSIITAQYGTKFAYKISAEKSKSFLALIIIGAATYMAYHLFIPPENPFSVVVKP